MIVLRSEKIELAYHLAMRLREYFALKNQYNNIFTTVGIELHQNEDGIPVGFIKRNEADHNNKVALRIT